MHDELHEKPFSSCMVLPPTLSGSCSTASPICQSACTAASRAACSWGSSNHWATVGMPSGSCMACRWGQGAWVTPGGSRSLTQPDCHGGGASPLNSRR